jgi:GTP-binding protein EngB required for normal cell division
MFGAIDNANELLVSQSRHVPRRKELLSLVKQLTIRYLSRILAKTRRGVVLTHSLCSDIDLPRVVCVGTTSAGKSSLIEAISRVSLCPIDI